MHRCQSVSVRLLSKYSRSQKNGDASVPFRPVQTEVKRPFPMPKNGNGTGGGRRDGKCSRLIPIVASTKMTPQKPKKAKRSIALSKRSHLEAIKVDWQREIDRSSIADFEPSRASIAELAQNRRAVVVNCLRTV